MSAYIDAGYVVALGTLAVYGSTLVVRERAARRRVEGAVKAPIQPTARAETGESDRAGGPSSTSS